MFTVAFAWLSLSTGWYQTGRLSELLDGLKLQAAFIRPAILIVVYLFFPQVVSILIKFKVLSIVKAKNLIGKRNRLFLWIIIFELLVGQRLFGIL